MAWNEAVRVWHGVIGRVFKRYVGGGLARIAPLCVKTGVAAAGLGPIPIKKHGRRA